MFNIPEECLSWMSEQGFTKIDSVTWRMDLGTTWAFVTIFEGEVHGHLTRKKPVDDKQTFSKSWRCDFQAEDDDSLAQAICACADEALARVAEDQVSGSLPFFEFGTMPDFEDRIAPKELVFS